jgi:hypothetical protein
MRNAGSWLAGVFCVAMAAPILAAEAPTRAQVVLDETCCLRRYYRFGEDLISPAAMRSAGQETLGDVLYGRVSRATQKSLAVSGNDNFAVFRPSLLALKEARKVGTSEALRRAKDLQAEGVDWRECVFRRMFYDPFTAPPPPVDWAAPSFDDTSWVDGRGPFQVDMPNDLPADATEGSMAKVHVGVLQFLGAGLQACYYRGRFVVDDPARAGDLTFRATYRGGIRVLINGREIARGHLPKGELAADAAGDDYPREAYENGSLRNRTIGPVTIPAGVLCKGTNVLAIEVRASLLHPVVLKTELSKSWNSLHDHEGIWRHCFLGEFVLASPTGAIASSKTRPAGLQVWAADMHTRVSSDDLPLAGEAAGMLRLVGAQNGTYAGQIVIGSDKGIEAVKADVSDLKMRGGPKTIPGSAVTILHLLPYPANGFTQVLGDERGLGGSFPSQKELEQHWKMNGVGGPYNFDQITTRAQSVTAGTSRPIWVSLRIPADAAAGKYTGAIQIQADSQPSRTVPVEVEVIGWRLPDPKDFQTYAGCEENPYGAAKQYGVSLWSREHFQLLAASFEQLGRAGNRWLNVPVLRGTEFGNKDDSMIRWIRGKDGKIRYDFAVLDRYLDLAVRLQGPPRMINFVVMAGMDNENFPASPEVMVFDEATGRPSPMPAGGKKMPLADKEKIWKPFATALYQHMKAKNLDKAMHWGYPLDSESDHDLVMLLGEHLPAVKWTGGPHQIGNWGYKEPKYYDVFGTVRYFDNWPGFRMSMGWKAPQTHLAIPRIDSSVMSLTNVSHPFGYRTLVSHSLALGRCGFERVGADEWASIHYDGMRIPTWIVGMPVLFTLWPGEHGAESSARFEALIEGIQEGEARIYLEKALDSGKLPAKLAQRVQDVLNRHFQGTGFFQNKLCVYELEKYYFGWQERSRNLYQVAAEVAAADVSTGTRKG